MAESVASCHKNVACCPKNVASCLKNVALKLAKKSDIAECLKTLQFVLKCFSLFDNVAKYLIILQNV